MILKALAKLVLKDYIDELKEDATVYKDAYEKVFNLYRLYSKNYNDEVELRAKVESEVVKITNMHNIYKYLSLRLFKCTDIETPANFDITNIYDAKELSERFINGDLVNK